MPSATITRKSRTGNRIIITASQPSWSAVLSSLIKRKNKTSTVVKELIQMVIEKGGLEYAEVKMNEFKDKAVTALMEFEDCEARTSLIDLMNYITTRKK